MKAVANALRALISHWLQSRQAAVTAGILLILVPTLFGVFPNWSGWAWWTKLAIMLAWALAALFVVYGTARQSEHIRELMGEPRRRRDKQRTLAGNRLIPALLSSSFMPNGYDFRLYLYDKELKRLLPSYQTPGADPVSEGWERGQGVTGRAFAREDYVIARGTELHHESFGLTDDQQTLTSRVKVAAAMPVTNARGRTIAILTVSGKHDDGWLASDAGWELHSQTADILARVLVDVLRVARD